MARLDHILDILRAHQDDLRARGVLHAGVFGSVARGEDTEDSDVDVALDLDRANPPDIWTYVGIGQFLEAIIGQDVDMAVRDNVRQSLRHEIDRDYRHAF